MHNPTEHFSTVARSQMQAQLGLASYLTETLIDSMQKLIGLNLNATKVSLDTMLTGTQQLLAAKDAQEFFSLSTHQAQTHAEIVMTYARHLASIGSDAQVELSRAAEEQVNKSSRQMVSLIDEVGKLTPSGSEGALSLMKSALDNVSASVGQMARNSKVAVEAMEHNIKSATEQASQEYTKSSRSKS